MHGWTTIIHTEKRLKELTESIQTIVISKLNTENIFLAKVKHYKIVAKITVHETWINTLRIRVEVLISSWYITKPHDVKGQKTKPFFFFFFHLKKRKEMSHLCRKRDRLAWCAILTFSLLMTLKLKIALRRMFLPLSHTLLGVLSRRLKPSAFMRLSLVW